jgi:hypothetical protein
MNIRLERYLSGAPYHARTIYPGGGRRVAVFDRTLRWRSVARAMRAAGHRDSMIACSLGRSRETLDRVLSFSFRF